jgi:hypothetical protein
VLIEKIAMKMLIIIITITIIIIIIIIAEVAQSLLCLTRTGPLGFDPRQGQRIFFSASASRPARGPTQPPMQWVPWVLSVRAKRGRGVMLTTHPHLVPKSRMSRSYTSFSPKQLHGV